CGGGRIVWGLRAPRGAARGPGRRGLEGWPGGVGPPEEGGGRREEDGPGEPEGGEAPPGAGTTSPPRDRERAEGECRRAVGEEERHVASVGPRGQAEEDLVEDAAHEEGGEHGDDAARARLDRRVDVARERGAHEPG